MRPRLSQSRKGLNTVIRYKRPQTARTVPVDGVLIRLQRRNLSLPSPPHLHRDWGRRIFLRRKRGPARIRTRKISKPRSRQCCGVYNGNGKMRAFHKTRVLSAFGEGEFPLYEGGERNGISPLEEYEPPEKHGGKMISCKWVFERTPLLWRVRRKTFRLLASTCGKKRGNPPRFLPLWALLLLFRFTQVND